MKPRVLAPRHLPSRPPWLHLVVLWLFLDRIQAPGWFQGVCWTLASIVTIVMLIGLWREEYCEPVWKDPSAGSPDPR